MPYISADNDRREKLRRGELARNAGELNYQIFYYVKHVSEYYNGKNVCVKEDIKRFIENFLGEKPNYQRYNDMTGALTRCYREIKRRFGIRVQALIDIRDSYDNEINDYEDTKIISNGDVE